MADYIDREVALEVLNELARSNFTLKPGYEYYLGALNDVGQEIKYLPSADVKPVVHGKWVASSIPCEEYVCSNCGGACWYYDYQGKVARSNFCPNCGADMRGNDNERE